MVKKIWRGRTESTVTHGINLGLSTITGVLEGAEKAGPDGWTEPAIEFPQLGQNLAPASTGFPQFEQYIMTSLLRKS